MPALQMLKLAWLGSVIGAAFALAVGRATVAWVLLGLSVGVSFAAILLRLEHHDRSVVAADDGDDGTVNGPVIRNE